LTRAFLYSSYVLVSNFKMLLASQLISLVAFSAKNCSL
jgi:hypothetical protein